jgi:hypothetical protein
MTPLRMLNPCLLEGCFCYAVPSDFACHGIDFGFRAILIFRLGMSVSQLEFAIIGQNFPKERQRQSRPAWDCPLLYRLGYLGNTVPVPVHYTLYRFLK